MQLKFWYSREEAATLLSLSLREVDRLIKTGMIETCRHGRRRLVLGDSLTIFGRNKDTAKTGPKGNTE
jgi:excisionase family DNA binding protein